MARGGKRAGRGVGGNGIPKATFGANRKFTQKGSQMGQISAKLPQQGGGSVMQMGMTSKVAN